MAGQIIQRGERTWLVRLYVGRVQGKRKYDGHTVHGTKKDAQAYLNAKLRERDLGTYASERHTLCETTPPSRAGRSCMSTSTTRAASMASVPSSSA